MFQMKPSNSQREGETMGINLAFWSEFSENESGATAVEYCIVLSLIIIVCLISIAAIGTATSAVFESSAEALGFNSPTTSTDSIGIDRVQ